MLACWQRRMYSVQLDANVHSIRLAQITRCRRGHDRKLLREAFKNADHCGDAPFLNPVSSWDEDSCFMNMVVIALARWKDPICP